MGMLSLKSVTGGASVAENPQREPEARPRRQHAEDRQRARPVRARGRAGSPSGEQRRRPANAGQRYPAEILTPDEVRALIKACSNRAPTGIRNRALLVLLYRGGLRITEALRLHPKDLDRAAGTVTVLRGKGGKRRTIGLDPGAFAVVERWLDARAKRRISGRAPLICTLHGKPGRERVRAGAHAPARAA